MTTWPVPSSVSREAPRSGPGSFWEDRGDRRHCGVDIYAPAGSAVLAVEAGTVAWVRVFTSPEAVPYWNETYEVLVRGERGGCLRYAELGGVEVVEGERVAEGQAIGSVGTVIDVAAVDGTSPPYILEIASRGATSMLHIEAHRAVPPDDRRYLGGNWFGGGAHPTCTDPTPLLMASARAGRASEGNIVKSRMADAPPR